jgi:hypothetical protein
LGTPREHGESPFRLWSLKGTYDGALEPLAGPPDVRLRRRALGELLEPVELRFRRLAVLCLELDEQDAWRADQDEVREAGVTLKRRHPAAGAGEGRAVVVDEPPEGTCALDDVVEELPL